MLIKLSICILASTRRQQSVRPWGRNQFTKSQTLPSVFFTTTQNFRVLRPSSSLVQTCEPVGNEEQILHLITGDQKVKPEHLPSLLSQPWTRLLPRPKTKTWQTGTVFKTWSHILCFKWLLYVQTVAGDVTLKIWVLKKPTFRSLVMTPTPLPTFHDPSVLFLVTSPCSLIQIPAVINRNYFLVVVCFCQWTLESWQLSEQWFQF